MALVFTISIKEGYSHKNYIVKHQPVDKRKEYFIVDREGEHYQVESNRPLIRQYAKKRRPDFQLSGNHSWSFTEKLFDAIWAYVKIAEASGAI